MSRSGYIDSDDDNLAYGRYRGAVASAIRGRRGQSFLIEMIAALDALDEKRLCAESFLSADGDVCALGSVARSRGMDIAAIEWPPTDECGQIFSIADALASEIMYWNDEVCGFDGPDTRWRRMRDWARNRILP